MYPGTQYLVTTILEPRKQGGDGTVFPPATPLDSCFEQRVKGTDRPKQKIETLS